MARWAMYVRKERNLDNVWLTHSTLCGYWHYSPGAITSATRLSAPTLRLTTPVVIVPSLITIEEDRGNVRRSRGDFEDEDNSNRC